VLQIDPAEILGVERREPSGPVIAAHFKKDDAVRPETAEALAHLILAAQRALLALGDHDGDEQ
jgi:hypothetical protein